MMGKIEKTFFSLLVITIIAGVLVVLVAMIDKDENVSDWVIDKSPITGRYYEIRFDKGFRHNGMSEVTEEEYNKYLEMIDK